MSANNGRTAAQMGPNMVGPTHLKKKPTVKNSNRFKGATDAIKDHVFVYHSLSTKKWMKSKGEFIAYAGRKYTGNEMLSLKKENLQLRPCDSQLSPAQKTLQTGMSLINISSKRNIETT